MNSALLLFGVLLVVTPVTLMAQLDSPTDLLTRFNIQQLAMIRGFLLSGITFVVIALVMILWMI